MTTFLADSAFSPNRDGIYPEKQLSTRMGYPSRHDFEVRQTTNGSGNGILARKRFAPLERMCRVSGLIVSRRRLHTLQILPDLHMYYPRFAGFLQNGSASCRERGWKEVKY